MRKRRITLRARLTLLHGGLFFAAGIVLLGVTHVLFAQQLDRGGDLSVRSDSSGNASPGRNTPSDSLNWVADEQKRLHDAATASLITQGGIALTLVGGVAAGFGWLVAGRVLAPLRRVTDTARRIASAPAAGRGLHERIA
ncbi:two-component sensor histidine kinase, partial [Streptomyces sp. NPDC057540]